MRHLMSGVAAAGSVSVERPAEMPTPTPRWTGPVGCACCRMPSNQLRPRERASEPSHNVLASTLLPQREFMEATFKTT